MKLHPFEGGMYRLHEVCSTVPCLDRHTVRPFRDLISCPACKFIAIYDAIKASA